MQDHLEQLQSILHRYTLQGLPRIPDLYTRGRPHYDRSLFRLEDNWTEVVSNHVSLSKRQKDQQEAIWEFLTTEVEYIHKLKVIIDVSLPQNHRSLIQFIRSEDRILFIRIQSKPPSQYFSLSIFLFLSLSVSLSLSTRLLTYRSFFLVLHSIYFIFSNFIPTQTA